MVAMKADDQPEPDSHPRPAPPPVQLPGAQSPEQRTLTTEEFRQLDTMLGGQDFPTLIRSGAPTPSARAKPGLLQTLVVAIILAAIVALRCTVR